MMVIASAREHRGDGAAMQSSYREFQVYFLNRQFFELNPWSGRREKGDGSGVVLGWGWMGGAFGQSPMSLKPSTISIAVVSKLVHTHVNT